MKILIVGGSGHVSGAVARATLVKGYEVWAITRGKRALSEGVKALVADRHDHNAIERVVAGQDMVWDLVVDCICYELRDIRQDIALFRQRASQFVLVSTDFVYDSAHRRFPQPEEANSWAGAGGPTDYGWKKRLCEEELINGDTGRMAWTIVRPCHVYGPTSELGCLPLHGRDPKLIENLRSGKALHLVGGGHFLQQPILADDLAETIVSIAGNNDARRKIFNVAGPDVIESWQYYQIVADVLDVKLTVEEIPVGPYLDEHPEKAPFLCHRIYDLCRIKAAGLSVPSTPIAKGLRLHVEGLLASREQTQCSPK
jgi:nucleoside-diphosphate-sugar epimerase